MVVEVIPEVIIDPLRGDTPVDVVCSVCGRLATFGLERGTISLRSFRNCLRSGHEVTLR